MNMNAFVFITQEGDWEGLYIDGKIISQGHNLGDSAPEAFWLDIAHRYGLRPEELTKRELPDGDNAVVLDLGRMPDKLKEQMASSIYLGD
jgi:hypothetical protein